MTVTHPHVVSEWHHILNGALVPETVTAGSNKLVWWQCKQGHEWEAVICSRTRKKLQGCPYCSGQRVLIGFNDLATRHSQVASEWHPTFNGDLTPEMVTMGSGKKVWWKCKEGHEWKAIVVLRTRHSNPLGCPMCSGHQVLQGYNDLATTYPDVAAQWHPTLNGDLTPEGVTRGSGKKVWWKCKLGHEWKAIIVSRTGTQKYGCPVCSGQQILIGFNDLATTHPDIAAEWDENLNAPLTVNKVSAGTNTKVWWKCVEGHTWNMKVYRRTEVNPGSCPYCSGNKLLQGFNDLATIYPALAAEWHPTRNGNLSPREITQKVGHKVWWLGKCGHEWEGLISHRTRSQPYNCPYCSGRRVLAGYNDLATTRPLVASEWHPTLNDDLSPCKVSTQSGKKVWWQCGKGHEWPARISDRTRSNQGSGCPTCAAHNFISRGEQGIADYLTKELGLTITQSNRSLLKSTELDIYIPEKQLAIEYNGVYWHSSAMQSDHQYHQKKYEQAQQAGIQLLQIWEDEWENKQELVKRILAHKLGVSQEPLVGARSTSIEAIPLAEARTFLNEYHIQGHSNGSYYLGLRSQKTNQLVALMVLFKRSAQNNTLEIVRYATSHRVPGGFTKLLKHVEATLQPSRLVTFADHCISDGGLYAQNGFTAEKELKPDYRYLVLGQRVHKFGYRLARFKSDPSLLWEPNLTETQLAQLNGLHRVYDAGKTRWVKTL